MKKIFTLLFMISTFVVSYSQDATFYKLPTGSAPIINGKIDVLWDGIQSYTMEKLLSGGVAPTPNGSYWKAAWNDTAIFVMVKVIDDEHCDEWCSGQPSWESDKVELYFDVNDILNDNVGAETVSSGHLQIAPAYEKGKTQFSTTTYYGNCLFTYAYKITADTVIFEYSIPFSSLKDKNSVNLNPNTIDTIGFDVTIIDRDSDYGSRKLASWMNNVLSWNSMDNSGKVVFKSSTSQRISVHNSGSTINNNSTLNFGFVASGIKKDTIISVTNGGISDLTLTSIVATGTGFSVVQPSDMVLSLNETKKIKISILDNNTGLKSGKIIINSNDPSNPVYTINLVAGVNLTPITDDVVSGKWVKSRSPYYIFNDLLIQDGMKLEIEPGVRVEFQGYYGIDIKGCLQALGEKLDTIRFTVKDTAGLYNINLKNGSWTGLRIRNEDRYMDDNDTTKLQYCIVEYAKTISGLAQKDERGAGFYVLQCKKLKILNSIFRYNYTNRDGGAIYISNSEVQISDSKFLNNYALIEGGAVAIDNNAKPLIKNCEFLYNTAQNGGAIRICCNSTSQIENSLIANNRAANGGGMYLVTANSVLINNIISNNTADTLAGGLLINNCQPQLYNNNICYNVGHQTGGIHIWDISPANFTNNIIWGNYCSGTAAYNQIDLGMAGQPKINHCIIQGGFNDILKYSSFKGDTSLIISKNPDFIKPPLGAGIQYNASSAKWNVSSNSTAINQGSELPDYLNTIIKKDYYGNKRIFHSSIDIGAVEKHILSENVQGDITKNTRWIADTIKITGNTKVTDSVTLEIAPGTVVEFQSFYSFNVYGKIISKGLPDAMIKFTIKDTTGFSNTNSNSGGWKGISMNNSYQSGAGYTMPDDSLIFDYTIIEFVKNRDKGWDKSEGGAIQIKYFSKVRVSNCILRNNIASSGAGINIDGFSHPVIIGNKIYNNRTISGLGGGINIAGNSNPTILNNIISNNYGEGALTINSSNPTVINNVISNNKSFANAGGVLIATSYPYFANNTIVNNYATYEGGGICIFDSDVKTRRPSASRR